MRIPNWEHCLDYEFQIHEEALNFVRFKKGLGSKKPSVQHVALRPTGWNTGWRSQFHTPTPAPAPQTRQGDGRRFTGPARMVSPNKHARATRYTDWTKCTDCFFL